jgi:hypothetical protein
LVIGILVDDAIVEIENIVRHIRMGKSPYQAALEAADEIGLAVMATTMSIIVVFLACGLYGWNTWAVLQAVWCHSCRSCFLLACCCSFDYADDVCLLAQQAKLKKRTIASR